MKRRRKVITTYEYTEYYICDMCNLEIADSEIICYKKDIKSDYHFHTDCYKMLDESVFKRELANRIIRTR